MMVLLFFASIFILSIFVFALVYFNIMRRGQEIRILVKQGKPAKAKVLHKIYHTPHKKEHFEGIVYEFTTPTGEVFERTVHLPASDDALYREGSMIDVEYDPQKPSTNALKSLVDQVR